MTAPVVQCRGVRYAYPGGEVVLSDIDLCVAPGESVLLVGPSGSGKSTLLRCLNGLVPHFYGGTLEGEVVVCGQSVRAQPPAMLFERVGLVPQNPAGALFASTVEEEIAFGLESLGLPADAIAPRVRAAAEAVGLSEHLAQVPHELSGGQQQRLLIAVALAVRPAVLALDEPFAHLDPAMAEELAAILRRLTSDGVTVIVAEHRLGAILEGMDRLVVLEGGRIVADGPTAQLAASDLTRYGVNVPLAVRCARAAGLDPLPLGLESLVTRLQADGAARERLRASLLAAHAQPAVPAGSADPVIEFRAVTSHIGKQAVLAGVDFAIARGERLALLGRNGAGKTSLLKHINGLLRPASGEVLVAGQPVGRRAVSSLARHVGFVFQNPNDQFFQPSVAAELATGPQALGRTDPTWLGELVERFDLGPLVERSPFRLSEGQKKRVSFAAALAARSEVLLLDEPSTGQDERFRRELVRLAGECSAEGRTVVVATHDVELADELAGRWLVLDEGRLAADGRPMALLGDPSRFRASGLRPAGLSWLRALLSDATEAGCSIRGLD